MLLKSDQILTEVDKKTRLNIIDIFQEVGMINPSVCLSIRAVSSVGRAAGF